jgi:hypothetical protein
MDPTAPKFRQGMEAEYLPEIERMNRRAEWCRLALRSCAERQQCVECRQTLRPRLPEEYEGPP